MANVASGRKLMISVSRFSDSRDLSLPVFCHCLPDLVHQFCKLRFGIPSFLEVKICPVVHRFDDNFLAAPAREEDERDVPGLLRIDFSRLMPSITGIR